MNMTEDQVRDYAKRTLGLEDTESAKAGVGQLTTFNQLGFKGVSDRPDGWYLPNEKMFPAIVIEAKSTVTTLKKQQIAELLKNCKIVSSQYVNVVGILYNGEDIVVFKNGEKLQGETELHNKEYLKG